MGAVTGEADDGRRPGANQRARWVRGRRETEASEEEGEREGGRRRKRTRRVCCLLPSAATATPLRSGPRWGAGEVDHPVPFRWE